MYDELIKDLRENHDKYFARDMQAADAIEQLIEERDAYRKAMTHEHNRAAKLTWEKEHCWIPVTERLPEEKAPCIVYNKYYGPMIGWRVDGERFRIPGSRFPDHPTHWMPLPHPPKEG